MQDMMSYAGIFAGNSFNSKFVSPGQLRNLVLKNKKTGAVVEVRDVSAFAAAKKLKWRPRHTVLIEETPVELSETEKQKEE
jgi:hypothetical protein